MNRTSHAANHPLRTGLAVGVVMSLTLWVGRFALARLIAVLVRRPAPNIVPPVKVTRVDADTTSTPRVTMTAFANATYPGRYALLDPSGARYEVGDIIARRWGSAIRTVLSSAVPEPGTVYRFSTFTYEHPADTGFAWEEVVVTSPVGALPAWLIPSPASDRWVIVIHGRGATRAEGLRAAAVWHELGVNALFVSYRNDPDAPASSDARYGLGSTEWIDIDAAIDLAVSRGASSVLLMGWSMGGSIAFQTLLAGRHRAIIVGAVMDSPAVDWENILRFQASLYRLPRSIGSHAYRMLQRHTAEPPDEFNVDRLRVIDRASELDVPILILHSIDDGFVPSEPSERLAALRRDVVRTELFRGARHTRLWNVDPDRWTSLIRSWYRDQIVDAHQR